MCKYLAIPEVHTAHVLCLVFFCGRGCDDGDDDVDDVDDVDDDVDDVDDVDDDVGGGVAGVGGGVGIVT